MGQWMMAALGNDVIMGSVGVSNLGFEPFQEQKVWMSPLTLLFETLRACLLQPCDLVLKETLKHSGNLQKLTFQELFIKPFAFSAVRPVVC